MPEYPISQNGVFVDSKTGQVVESQPEEGVQLVAPGGEITPAVERDIQLAKDAATGVSHVATVGAGEPATEQAAEAEVDDSGTVKRNVKK